MFKRRCFEGSGSGCSTPPANPDACTVGQSIASRSITGETTSPDRATRLLVTSAAASRLAQVVAFAVRGADQRQLVLADGTPAAPCCGPLAAWVAELETLRPGPELWGRVIAPTEGGPPLLPTKRHRSAARPRCTPTRSWTGTCAPSAPAATAATVCPAGRSLG